MSILLPSVPKFTQIDTREFDKQYDKCLQIVDMLYDTIIKLGKRNVSAENIQIIMEHIDKFYELSNLVAKSIKVSNRIKCIDELKNIIKIINTEKGFSDLKLFYDKIRPKHIPLKN